MQLAGDADLRRLSTVGWRFAKLPELAVKSFVYSGPEILSNLALAVLTA